MSDESRARTGDLESPPRILGLDEAGRGSFVGPLVVGGFLVAETDLPQLTSIGVRDSKALSPKERERLLVAIGRIGQCIVRRIPPRVVDRWVGRGGLNDLEAREFGRIVRWAGAHRAYVDACDPVARRFGQRVAQAARSPAVVIARHHADRDLPVVAAASIVAKVHRDRWIDELAASLEAPLGSGYPSDERTMALVQSKWASTGELPPWVRRSWASTERLKPRPTGVTLEEFGP